ncbi:MAG: hypothetical protein IT320_13800 [Anaerolineae bacterium]|nr:hypothetical protein [Anaerolineae bacterium]
MMMRNWRARLAILALICIGVGALPVFAQTGGQFCVRAFEDRDGNGEWAGAGTEPALTRDVAINLMNADSVVVASGLLENSPTAAQGILCFQFLPAGQYTAVITSVSLTPTTPMSISAAVNETGEPVVVNFGAQPESTVPAANSSATGEVASESDQVLRVGLSVGGALIMMVAMVAIGALFYALVVRRPRTRLSPSTATSTGTLPPVRSDDTPTHN